MDESALRRIELFSSLSRKQRRLLAMRGDEVDVPAGKVLCCEGKTAHEFFVIEEGTARVARAASTSTSSDPATSSARWACSRAPDAAPT